MVYRFEIPPKFPRKSFERFLQHKFGEYTDTSHGFSFHTHYKQTVLSEASDSILLFVYTRLNEIERVL